MIGKLLGTAVKVITCPLDIGEAFVDVATGGDGSRKELKNAFPCASSARDAIVKTIEQIDD